jgi:hypothetical protein
MLHLPAAPLPVPPPTLPASADQKNDQSSSSSLELIPTSGLSSSDTIGFVTFAQASHVGEDAANELLRCAGGEEDDQESHE